mmetsp:Transcript_6695/g.14598  ORF Transcript_6695/g.14598 Transcript_6695/m.14598 type:complete len:94 (+) Transcript_6695:156-437(+)
MSSESMNPQSNSNPSEVGVDPMAMVRNAIATVSPSSITPETESAVNDDAASCAVPPPLPVTVLSGFLGAGKTTGECQYKNVRDFCNTLVQFFL